MTGACEGVLVGLSVRFGERDAKVNAGVSLSLLLRCRCWLLVVFCFPLSLIEKHENPFYRL